MVDKLGSGLEQGPLMESSRNISLQPIIYMFIYFHTSWLTVTVQVPALLASDRTRQGILLQALLGQCRGLPQCRACGPLQPALGTAASFKYHKIVQFLCMTHDLSKEKIK